MRHIRNYVWDTYGELLRGAIIIALGVLFTAISQTTGWEELDFGWWRGVTFAVALAVIQYVMGKLPPAD